MEGELKQPANSIELARNAKGEYSYHIKCRGDSEHVVLDLVRWWQRILDGEYPVKVKDADSTDK